MFIHNIKFDSLIDISNINLAIGNFDGVHLGHQKIISKLINYSKKMKMYSAILSFIPHPRQYFSKQSKNYTIISDNLKIKLFNKFGIDHLIFLNFDKSVASLTPEEFIKTILIHKLKIKNLFVGYDFKFGKDRKGDVNLLKQISLGNDFTVSIIDPIKSNNTSEIYSSSLIRKNIHEGNFEKVNRYLGRNWSMTGRVIYGTKRASKMNFPTANIIPPNTIHPKKGVYVVRIQYNNNSFNGVANFGVRPTVDGSKLLLEVHIFDFKEDIYDKDLTVEFLTFIRDEKKFDNFDQLIQQVYEDIKVAKAYDLKN